MKRRHFAQALALFVRTMLESVTFEVEFDGHNVRRVRVPEKMLLQLESLIES
jgi:hypothetical protein